MGAAIGCCLYNCNDRIIFLVSAPTSATSTITRLQPLEFPAVVTIQGLIQDFLLGGGNDIFEIFLDIFGQQQTNSVIIILVIVL